MEAFFFIVVLISFLKKISSNDIDKMEWSEALSFILVSWFISHFILVEFFHFLIGFFK
jgi:hypothetical protein